MKQIINNTGSRTKHSIANIVFGVVNFAIKTVMIFIVRKVFIMTLGLEYLGLNSLFANVLTLLSIAEVGIGTAVSQTLYGYLANNEKEKIGALLGFYKKINYIIAAIVASIGCLLIPFLKFIVTPNLQINVSLEIIYILTLLNVIASYIFSYRKVIYQTNQRIDLLFNITSVYYIVLYIAQIIILFLTKNYLLYLASNILITILENITIHLSAKKSFSEFVSNEKRPVDKEISTKVKNNVKGLLCQKVGSTIIFGTDNILISMLVLNGIEVLGKYSNYILITSALSTIINQILNAITASIGNVLVEKDRDYNYNLFKTLNFTYVSMIGLACAGFIVLSNDFILIFFGKDLNLKTIDIVLLGLSFYLTETRYMVKTYKEANGIISQFKSSYLIQAFINIVVSIILGKFIGITGIILGTIVSTISIPLWNEYYLTNKYYFKKNVKDYFLRYGIYLTATAITVCVCWLVNSLIPATSFLMLIVKFLIFIIVAAISYILLLCWTREFREAKLIAKRIIKAKK